MTRRHDPLVSIPTNSWPLAVCFIIAVPTLWAAEDIAVADFEGRDCAPWTTTGEAFGTGPARGSLPEKMPVSGFEGSGLVNSFHGGDDATGGLTSPEFKINKRYLHIPIRNGAPKRKVTTLVDGRVEVVNDIELADGTPDWWAFMDAGAWRGKTVTIQVDELRDDSKALSSLVLLYTAAGDPTVQCIASSTDGRNFTKFPGNPVIPQITGGNRDPKVIWHEPTKRWVMVLYVTLPGEKHTVHFLTSTNLREWTRTCIVEGGTAGDKFLYECPDFFELPVDGDAAVRKWVLLGADSNYATGSFDVCADALPTEIG